MKLGPETTLIRGCYWHGCGFENSAAYREYAELMASAKPCTSAAAVSMVPAVMKNLPVAATESPPV